MIELDGLNPVQLDLEKTKAEIRLKNSEALRNEIQAQQWGKEIEKENASAEESGVYTFYGPVKPEAVLNCMLAVDDWRRRKGGDELTIVINSPGGSTLDGLALYDFIQEVKKDHKVITVGVGIVASMAAALLQAGDVRVLGNNSFLMVHEGSAKLEGKNTEISKMLSTSKKVEKKILKIMAERSIFTEAQIRNRWKNDDWFMDAEEALKNGFIDEIR